MFNLHSFLDSPLTTHHSPLTTYQTPLLAFLFANPLTMIVTAAGAVAIPVVIHLLNRRRYQVVTWAAMRFLLAAEKKNSRRLRIEQLILLLLRALIVLLLVLAMASVTAWGDRLWTKVVPDGSLSSTTPGRRTHHIIVIDGSVSMAARSGDTNCFERSRRRAFDIVRRGQPGDGYSIVVMGDSPRRLIGATSNGPGPSELTDRVTEEIEQIRLPHGNADLARTLEAVADILKQSPVRYAHREIYFITDLQQATWILPQPDEAKSAIQALNGDPTKPARTLIVDSGGGVSPVNRAVTSVSLAEPLAVTGSEVTLKATIVSHGGDTSDRVRVALKVGKAPQGAGDPPLQLVDRAHEEITLARGDNLVAFKYRFDSPGDYVVQIAIENDGLELDDVRTVVIPVRESIPVLLVNGRPAGFIYDQSTEYVYDALNPIQSTTSGGPKARIKPRKISAAQFASDPVGSDLTPYDCVFLCDVPHLGVEERQRLEAHARRGGGIIFALGPQVDLAAYNDVLYRNGQGLLPARLIGRERAPEGYEFHFEPAEDARTFQEPPLKVFAEDSKYVSLRSQFLQASFSEYFRCELPSRLRPRLVLNFIAEAQKPRKPTDPPPPPDKQGILGTRSPALVIWNPPRIEDRKGDTASPSLRQPPLLRGRVALLTTTVNKEWNDWTPHPSFLPVMQELLQHCCAGRLREQAVSVNSPLELFLMLPSSDTRVTLNTPDGRTENTQVQTADEGYALRWLDTDISGVYRATIGQHPQEYVFAVNVPPTTPVGNASESDLTRTNSDELHKTYPEWEFQTLTDPAEAAPPPRPSTAALEEATSEVGSAVARLFLLALLVFLVVEVGLAWFFGHYTSIPNRENQGSIWPAGNMGLVAQLSYWGFVAGLFLAGLFLAFVLIHAVVTGDFLSFLPSDFRADVERAFGVPPPADGEASRWHLEFLPYLVDRRLDPWLITLLLLGISAVVFVLYYLESKSRTGKLDAQGAGFGLLSWALRMGAFVLLMAVFLPQIRLWFERQSYPDVVILIDDSASMSEADEYRDPQVKAMAEKLQKIDGLKEPERLKLAQALVTRPDRDWLTELITERQVKVHIYHCSSRAQRVTTMSNVEGRSEAVAQIKKLEASERNDSSQLGASIRQVLNDFRGSSLSAIIMLTDGNTTEGESLTQAAQYAAQLKVPLFFIGVGDPEESRDLALTDLEVADTVFVNDNLIFNLMLTARGYSERSIKVRLLDETTGEELAAQQVPIDTSGKPVKVRLEHRPKEPGEKKYIIDIPVLPDEVDKRNNRVKPRPSVQVIESKPVKVRYIEGYARWEYRYVKTLLEREAARTNNKTVELNVLLIDADPEYAAQDKSALTEFPDRAKLSQYNVVIIGDVDPSPRDNPKMGQHLKDLADFVLKDGGGLLMIAGERHAPHAYRNTPLKDVLPIDIVEEKQPNEPDEGITQGFRPELTPTGRLHPIFSFNERDNESVWSHLQEMYWHSQGIQPKRAAEVLAVHPSKKDGPGKRGDRPLVVQQFVGSGRTLFFGFHETWRWRWREDELRFNQFWIQTVRYLSRTQQSRVELRLDRQVYRRGEPIKLTVRFPAGERPLSETEKTVNVQYERRNKQGVQQETNVIKLTKVPDSKTTFEGVLTRTPEGTYDFGLSFPQVPGPKPQADCEVEAPPGEKQQKRMSQAEMRQAAVISQGNYYTLAEADQVLHDIPDGTRMTLSSAGPPWLLWNHVLLFLMALGLLTCEWILRKLRYLL